MRKCDDTNFMNWRYIDFPTRKINLHFDYPPGNKHIPSKGNCEEEFPFLHWWDMLVPWRVVLKSPSDHNITNHCEKPIACDRSVLVLAATLPGLFPNENLYSRYSIAFLPLVWVFIVIFKIYWKTIIYLLAPKSSEKDEQHIGQMETVNPWNSKNVDKSTNFPVVPRRIPWRCCFCEFGKPWSRWEFGMSSTPRPRKLPSRPLKAYQFISSPRRTKKKREQHAKWKKNNMKKNIQKETNKRLDWLCRFSLKKKPSHNFS